MTTAIAHGESTSPSFSSSWSARKPRRRCPMHAATVARIPGRFTVPVIHLAALPMLLIMPAGYVLSGEPPPVGRSVPDDAGRSDAEGMAADPITGAIGDPTRAERMKWWTEARFGMFLCLDPFALKGWGDAGWHIAWNNITWEETEQLAERFNPTEFDARPSPGKSRSSGPNTWSLPPSTARALVGTIQGNPTGAS